MIQIGDKTFKVEIERKAIRNIYIRVDKDVIKVTCPRYTSNEEVYSFIREKLKWIYKVANKKDLDSKLNVGDTIFYHGKKYNFVVLYGNKNMKVEGDTITIRCRGNDIEGGLNTFYELTKKEILDEAFILEDKYLAILKDYGYYQEPIYKVKLLKSMWGVCYNRKNLINLSCRLIHFSDECLEAVLWHELLHFVIPNHSKRFHEVIEYHMPKYNEIIHSLH